MQRTDQDGVGTFFSEQVLQVGPKASKGFGDLRTGVREDGQRILVNPRIMGQSNDHRDVRCFPQLLRRFNALKQQHTRKCNRQSDQSTVNRVIPNGQLFVRANDACASSNFNDGSFRGYARALNDVLRSRFQQVDVHFFIDRQFPFHAEDVTLGGWNSTEAVLEAGNLRTHTAPLVGNGNPCVFNVALDRKTRIANGAV